MCLYVCVSGWLAAARTPPLLTGEPRVRLARAHDPSSLYIRSATRIYLRHTSLREWLRYRRCVECRVCVPFDHALRVRACTAACVSMYATNPQQGEELRDETMSDHDPLGSTLCIHSVVTAAAMRRRGVAQTMLREYIAHLKSEAPTVTLVKLIAKEAVTPL